MNDIFRYFYHIFMKIKILGSLAQLPIEIFSASPQDLIFINIIEIERGSGIRDIMLPNVQFHSVSGICSHLCLPVFCWFQRAVPVIRV